MIAVTVYLVLFGMSRRAARREAERAECLRDFSAFAQRNGLDSGADAFLSLRQDFRTAYAQQLQKLGFSEADIVDTHSGLGLAAVSAHSFYYRLDWHRYRLAFAESDAELTKLYESAKTDRASLQYFKTLVNAAKSAGDCPAEKLALDDIVMFRAEGSVSTSTEVSGGVNLSGAIMGGILAGDAGAIIGSHAGTNIQSKTVKHDNRKLYLYCRENGQVRIRQIVCLDFDAALAALKRLIPQKDEAYLAASGSAAAVRQMSKPEADVPQPEARVQQVSSTEDSVQQLLALKKLLDAQILTAEEFEAKKKQLLGL